MRRNRTTAGLTILELVVSASLTALVLLGAGSMLDASSNVTQSTTDSGTATKRMDTALQELGDSLRRSSLASARHLDGSTFSAGGSDTGLQLRLVTGYLGAPVTSELIEYRFDAANRELLRVDGPIVSILAREVTAFSVSRTGDLFTFSLTARAGRQDDRGRVASGSIQIAARNP